jgi:putative flippase GtrA
MASLLSRARVFRRSAHFRRLLKYASVSLISTGVTQVVLFLTYHVFTIGTAIECNVIATACASVPAYYLNRTWTWGKSGRSDIWREVLPFWSISFVGLVLSTVAVGIAAHNADRIAHGSLQRALIVNCANLLTYAVIWSGRYMIFNRYLFGDRAASVLIAEEEREHQHAATDDEGAELAPSQVAKSEVTDPTR